MSQPIEEKPICFVLMPISDSVEYEPGHFGRVYEHLLKPAIVAAGYTPVRADDTVKTDYIVVGIIQKIVESPMVVCDFSARNPNVMYELGIRHAFNKRVVLVKDRKTEKIFDIQGLRYAEYDESLRIDAVNKDVVKITSAIIETKNSSDKDLNSIVQLAAIKTAEVPPGQIISSETNLLLSAIGTLDRRLQTVEEHIEVDQAHFLVEKNKVTFADGTEAELGDLVFDNGKHVGALMGVNREEQSILMRRPSGIKMKIVATSPRAVGLTNIPS
jgi:hypothetical protein